LILLTQISACLHIPREVRAELEPERAQHNHFSAEPGVKSESGNEAKAAQ